MEKLTLTFLEATSNYEGDLAGFGLQVNKFWNSRDYSINEFCDSVEDAKDLVHKLKMRYGKNIPTFTIMEYTFQIDANKSIDIANENYQHCIDKSDNRFEYLVNSYFTEKYPAEFFTNSKQLLLLIERFGLLKIVVKHLDENLLTLK